MKTEERFWSKVRKTARCWLWTGSASPSSGPNSKWPYGHFAVVATVKNRRIVKAHHYAWFLKYGKWPKKKLLHKCDSTLCVRWSHLFEGSQGDNMKDCAQKGRLVSRPNFGAGETHWMNDPEKKKAWRAKRWTKKRRAEQSERMRLFRSKLKPEGRKAAGKGSRSR
jgi:hypothetical protein